MLRYSCTIGLWALFAAAPLLAQTHANTASLTLEQAGDLTKAGQFQKALKAYDELVKVDSLRVAALTMRGQLKFLDLNKSEDGFADVQEAVQLDPTNLLALTTRGNMYLSLSMPDRALTDMSVAMGSAKDGADSSIVLFITGLAYLQIRDFQDAYTSFAYCLSQDSLNTAALINMATTLDNLDRKEEALEIMLAVDARAPDDLATMSNIGFILSKMDRYPEAIQWFDKCVKLAPKEAVPLNNRGYAKLMNGDPDGAVKDIDRSLKLNPDNSYAYRNLGLAMQAKGEMDKACTAWEAALSRGFTRSYGPEVKALHEAHCH
ncbi:MAG: tetratricopeptide repeat protein [Flavobacteriales bacterium]